MPITKEDLDGLKGKSFKVLVKFCEEHNIPDEVLEQANSPAEGIQAIETHLSKEIVTVASQFPNLVQQTITKFIELRAELQRIARSLDELTSGLPAEDLKLVKNLAEKEALQLAHASDVFTDTFNLIILGDTSSGKSTFVNMLLGEKVLPMTNVPCNTIVTEIIYGEKMELLAYSSDSTEPFHTDLSREEGTGDVISDVLKFDDHKSWPPKYSRGVLKLPNPLLKHLRLIDSPGISEECELRNERTINDIGKFIPNCIGVIFVINSSVGGISDKLAKIVKNFSEVSGEKFGSKSSSLGALFVCNKWDTVIGVKEEERTLKRINEALCAIWRADNLAEHVVCITATKALNAICAQQNEPQLYHQFVDKFASFLHSAISSRIETIHTLARKYFWAVQRMVRARQRMPYLDFKVIKIFVGEAKALLNYILPTLKARLTNQLSIAWNKLETECKTAQDSIINPVQYCTKLGLSMPEFHEKIERELLSSFENFVKNQEGIAETLTTECKKILCDLDELIKRVKLLETNLYGLNTQPKASDIDYFSRALLVFGFITNAVPLGLVLLGLAIPVGVVALIGWPFYKLARKVDMSLLQHTHKNNPQDYLHKYCEAKLREWLDYICKKMDVESNWLVLGNFTEKYPMKDLAFSVVASRFSITSSIMARVFNIEQVISTMQDTVDYMLDSKANQQNEGKLEIYNALAEQLKILDGDLAIMNLRSTSQPQLSIPWGDIQPLQEISQGSFGAVFSGTWKQQQVALKYAKDPQTNQISFPLTPNTTFCLAEFVREACLLRDLEHEHVLKCFGWSWRDQKDAASFCIELCEASLATKLSVPATGPLVWLRYALQIAKGMAYLHKQLLIHRDLKPENILVYMAPEVSKQFYSLPADVFSYGIILWELYYWRRSTLTGNPFFAPCKPAPPASVNNLIAQCIAENDSERPTFADIIVRLKGIAVEIATPNEEPKTDKDEKSDKRDKRTFCFSFDRE